MGNLQKTEKDIFFLILIFIFCCFNVENGKEEVHGDINHCYYKYLVVVLLFLLLLLLLSSRNYKHPSRI